MDPQCGRRHGRHENGRLAVVTALPGLSLGRHRRTKTKKNGRGECKSGIPGRRIPRRRSGMSISTRQIRERTIALVRRDVRYLLLHALRRVTPACGPGPLARDLSQWTEGVVAAHTCQPPYIKQATFWLLCSSDAPTFTRVSGPTPSVGLDQPLVPDLGIVRLPPHADF